MDIQTPLPYIQAVNQHMDRPNVVVLGDIHRCYPSSRNRYYRCAHELMWIVTNGVRCFSAPHHPPPLSPLALGRNPRRMTKCFTPKVWLNFEPQVKKHLWGPRRCRSYRQIYRHLFSENYIFTSATTLIPLTFPPEEGEPRPPSIIAGGLDQPLTASFPLPALCALFLEIVSVSSRFFVIPQKRFEPL